MWLYKFSGEILLPRRQVGCECWLFCQKMLLPCETNNKLIQSTGRMSISTPSFMAVVPGLAHPSVRRDTLFIHIHTQIYSACTNLYLGLHTHTHTLAAGFSYSQSIPKLRTSSTGVFIQSRVARCPGLISDQRTHR